MIGGIISDGGRGIASLAMQAEEDVNACPEWASCGGFRTEVGDSLTADGILLIVKGGDNLGGLVKMLNGSVPGEEEAPDEKHEFHEEPELDRPEVAGALLVFAGPEAEVKANGDQVGDMVGSWVGGGSFRGNYRVHDIQGGGLFSADGGIFEPVVIELPREALVQPGM